MPQIDLGRVVGPQGAQGETGPYFTPAVDADGNISWTNNGGLVNPTTQNIKGPTGVTPDLTIGTVTTLDAGEDATVTITGTDEAPVLNFGIPKGDAGEVTEAELVAALALKADINSPALTGTPTTPTPGANDSSTQIANTAWVQSLIQSMGFEIYGFHIDSSESDPSAAVTYLASAVGKTPAYMDFNAGTFNWGSWADAFFLPRPCMLKYDGTVDYYLDPNNYGLKEDGTASDIADDTYGGNAMMEWGQNGKRIWYKIVPDVNDDTSASVYIASYQADSNYRAWSFINNQGNMVDHFYTSIYNGSIDGDGRLRSISGKTYNQLCQNKTAVQEIAAAELNNPSVDKLWYTEVYADVTLINLLLILMGKSLNTRAVFGAGRCGQASAASSMLATGTMDTNGLFYGSSSSANGVKVFGMENWWGNQWRRYAGHLMVNYVHMVKFTKGQQDGSTANDYNTTGSGYLTGIDAPQVNNYVVAMGFDANNFMTATAGSAGDANRYWCDYWYQASGTRYAFRGATADNSVGRVGAFFVSLAYVAGTTRWYIGAAPSCKPLS